MGANVFDLEVRNMWRSWRWSDGKAWAAIYHPPIVLESGKNYSETKPWDFYLYIDSESRWSPPTQGSYTMGLFHEINKKFECSTVEVIIASNSQYLILLPAAIVLTAVILIILKKYVISVKTKTTLKSLHLFFIMIIS